MNMTTRRHQRRQNGRVISSPRTDVNDRLAGLRRYGTQEGGMEKRLAIVDALGLVQGDQNVLVEERRIGVWGFQVVATGPDLPRPRPHECLPPDEAKGLLQPFLGRITGGCHHLRMEIPHLIQTCAAVSSHDPSPS